MRIFLLSLLIFMGSAQAVTHDDYVNDYFTEKSEQLTTAERDVIIFSRVETSNYLLDNIPGGRPLTDEEEARIIESAFIKGLTISTLAQAINEVRALYAINDQTLLMEESMAHTLNDVAPTNDGIKENAPIDLQTDIGYISKTLFGTDKKIVGDPITASFTDPESALNLETESWQIGDPRSGSKKEGTSFTTGTPSGIYDEGDKSIVGAIEDAMEYLQKLTSKPLAIEFPSRQNFSHGLCIGQMAPRIASSQAHFDTPGEFTDTPLVEALDEFDFLKDYEPILRRFLASDTKDFYGDIDTQVAANLATSVQREIMALLIGDLQLGVLRGSLGYIQDQRNYSWDRILRHNYLHLESFKEQILLFDSYLQPMYDLPDC